MRTRAPGRLKPALAWSVLSITLLCAWLLAQGATNAFPAYAEWISKKSGIQIDCAYCHLNKSGPTGDDFAQVGSLTSAQRMDLHTAESPILNDFGKALIKRLTYQGVVQSMSEPERAAKLMDSTDLDRDGVADGVEMRRGTRADDPLSAPPELAWQHRVRENWPFILVLLTSGIGALISFTMLARMSAKHDTSGVTER